MGNAGAGGEHPPFVACSQKAVRVGLIQQGLRVGLFWRARTRSLYVKRITAVVVAIVALFIVFGAPATCAACTTRTYA